SQFIEMFGDPVTNPMGWSAKTLGVLGELKNGMNFSSRDKGYELHCLGVGDFSDYETMENTENLSVISLNEMPSADYMLRNEDIVFVRSNGNKALVGRSIIVYPNKTPTTFSGFCIRYRLHEEKVNLKYLIGLLHSFSIRERLLSNGRGANITNLNQQMLSMLPVPLPPLELQNRFAAFVESTDKSKFATECGVKTAHFAIHLKDFHDIMISRRCENV
ncbi:MAG: restriction endonuclease subunit S, partial [Candidatus Pelethousia sp.]|nr:restriction endonuclease subunit S [Candidatus Pelethousia sp.]